MQLVITICAKLLLVIIIIYLFIYSFIYLFTFFAGRFSALCFSASNQNVSHDILNTLGGFGSYKAFGFGFS